MELPESFNDLHPIVRKLFPITDPSELAHLSEYRKQLQAYYTFNKIPPQYFDLPPEKEKLPSTPQALNSAVKHLFPCAPKNDMELRYLIAKLREHYTFRRLPNDYFKTRTKLPEDPKSIKTKLTYTYPITDKNLAKEFLAEIREKYRFNIPLPAHYITANPTDKPELPTDHTLVTKVKLTIPITTPRALVNTARILREHYFFLKIPQTWINIKDTKTVDKPDLPTDLITAIDTINQLAPD